MCTNLRCSKSRSDIFICAKTYIFVFYFKLMSNFYLFHIMLIRPAVCERIRCGVKSIAQTVFITLPHFSFMFSKWLYHRITYSNCTALFVFILHIARGTVCSLLSFIVVERKPNEEQTVFYLFSAATFPLFFSRHVNSVA